MKKLIIALGLLLIVVIVGMSTLLVLINPNDFRAYIAQQVEERSGYKLTLEGDLRWHIWPQLSILVGRTSITAPGAPQSLVDAENMRLDVSFLPLLSHQLNVKQIMLNNAVIRVTPDSKLQRLQGVPPVSPNVDVPKSMNDWKLDIGNLLVSNSLLIWQKTGDEQINFRNIDLEFSQNAQKQAQVKLNTHINRDQRELQLAMRVEMDLAHYPQQLSSHIEQMKWQLKGAGLPPQGLQGEVAATAEWQNDTQQFSLKNLTLTVNDNQLNGTISGKFNAAPQINIDLHTARMDLDSLLDNETAVQTRNSSTVSAPLPIREPIVVQSVDDKNTDSLLNTSTAQLKLRIDKLHWHKMDFNQVVLDMNNQRGHIAITTLTGKSGSGYFSMPGNIDLRKLPTKASFQPVLHDIELMPLLQSLQLPEMFTGKFSLNGVFQGDDLNAKAFTRSWQGTAGFDMESVSLNGLNFPQIVQRTLEKIGKPIYSEESEADYTEITQLKGVIRLNKAEMAFTDLQGQSALLGLTGKGDVNFDQAQCDFTLNIKMNRQWQGDQALLETLTNTELPLRIYGSWNKLQYSLAIDQLLRQHIFREAKSRFKDWLQHDKEYKKSDNLKAH